MSRGIAITGLVLGFALAPPVASAQTYYAVVPVLGVRPVVREHVTSVPHERCVTDRHAYREYDPEWYDESDHHVSPWRGLVGGLIGGLIGNQFGGGRGKTAFTVAGALAGAAIARESARERYVHSHGPVTRCEVEHRREVSEQVVGYDVTYLYQGREFTKRTDSYPGESMRVRISVDPVIASR